MLWKTISVLFVNIALMGGVQVFGVLALIPIYLYNGTQGKKMKWLFLRILSGASACLVFNKNDFELGKRRSE